ncbi:Tol-Pal system beta propeller repeat protein TolB [Achromobacter insolitus]|uniref:Tol-Pal system protein TolB n=1 Tax=Achromobacter insolitus TaxID=217204 RepID=A0A6S7F5J9_9BURK|nr:MULTISPECIES: Tol-Pal system beta propeller repeat protein TolB [Achromobacter]APX78960.1 Tol-Pal system beta propeller repeat protein TolB [Achromobacter insolitus]MDH3066718.1 Tol-Pal system beta propeller repeat protein TolB [Achromobacter insolitus]MDQ6216984.1 Tol-Pal system beta propeller repeat protein TolB [Achromobacter insolitus]MEB3099309.1 Tol-Pal system beta propeller repeat protein TolB [Achromobacter sp. D10]NGT14452.1 Tol-Pal system protein TolB [Achromobacter insolitus]
MTPAYSRRVPPLALWRSYGLGLLMLALACLMAIKPAHAQLRVDISGTGATQYPVAIADFAVDDTHGRALAEVIRADLTRTGQFRLINAAGSGLNVDSPIAHDDWRGKGADFIAYGSITRGADGRYDVRYRLADTVKKSQLDGVAFSGTEQELRRVAHQIADRIYEKITGVRGVFSTRIAYVLKKGATYELQVADADGQNPQVALRSREPIISPSWSPDGSKLAYVSFESGKPVVYVHNLASSARAPVANFKGNNSAPGWSPDGTKLAVALTRDGLSQIYIVGATDGSNPTRVTRSPGIDTEPSFTPDGASIIFTSDRSGGPQIYQTGSSGGEARRLTFNGGYNISPRISPDGSTLLYVARRDGAFRIASLNLSSGAETLLTDGRDDQSPSFAPNGMQVLYAAIQNGRSVLAGVSSDGRVRQTLSVLNGEIREPTWGPFTR